MVHCRVRDTAPATRVGFVVSRAVGGAVVRNKVRRRLRGVLIEHRSALPAGTDVVVRALPAAGSAPYELLREEFASALGTAARRAGSGATGTDTDRARR